MHNYEKNNKSKRSVRSLILIALLILTTIFVTYLSNNNGNGVLQKVATTLIKGEDDSGYTQGLSWNTIPGDDEKRAGDYLKIESATINSMIDGTAPFDSDDNAGNDSTEQNKIVRSYDSVTYDFNVKLIKKDAYINSNVSDLPFSDIYLYIEATLPEDCNEKVKWDLDSVKNESYVSLSEDGRTLQIIRKIAKNQLDNLNTILDLKAKVLSAENGFKFKPQVSVWLNESQINPTKTDIQNIEDVTVSSAPKYNISLKPSFGDLSKTVTVNYNGNNVKGRMYGAGFTLQLYNDSADKGLKGIQIPTEDINFDINMLVNKMVGETKTDVTSEINPILWNYDLNGVTTGKITGRTMDFGANTNYSRYTGPADTASGMKITDTNRNFIVYNSGNVTMAQTGNKINVNVSGYKFNNIFPNITINETPYPANVGCFSSVYFQFFVPEPTDIATSSGTYNIVLDEGAGSETNTRIMKLGTNQIAQKASDDDAIDTNYYNGINASYDHAIMLYKNNGTNYLPTQLDSGDAKAIKGQEFYGIFFIQQGVNDDIGSEIKSVNKFVKFDGAGFELLDYDDQGNKYYATPDTMTWKMWYVTKKDGTNWTNDAERNNAVIEDSNLVIYENKADIPSGKVIVGAYFESQGGILNVPTIKNNQFIKLRFKIKDTADNGTVYAMTQNDTFWTGTLDRTINSITNSSRNYPSSAFNKTQEAYVKSTYESVDLIGGGVHYKQGQSVKVITANLGLQKTVADITDTGETKTVYDMSNNEYNVTFKIQPTLNQDTSNAELLSNATIVVTDILPKGLTYESGTSSSDDPIITKNEDGTTTLTWNIYGCTANTSITPITYKAHIDEKSVNNTTYVNTAIASCEASGSPDVKSVCSIQILNPATQRLYKIAPEPVIELDGTLHYTIEFTNTSLQEVTDFKLLDVLPYNGDGRETLFNGTYILDHINITGTEGATLYTTNDESARTNVKASDSDLGTSSIWTPVTDSSNIKKSATAFAIKGNISANGSITVDLYLKTSGNSLGDVYMNSSSCSYTSQSKQTELKSVNVKIEVINRSIQGTVWLDENGDGIIETSETKLKGIAVQLLDENGNVAKDINNKDIASLTTDENGEYKFNYLTKGKYIVKILSNNYYDVTTKNAGDNVTINSKINSNKQTDIITDLNSDERSIEVKYQNAGLVVSKINIPVNKVWEDNNNSASKRPETIILKLIKYGDTFATHELTGNTTTNENWSYTFENVPKYNVNR
jgi:uncharacterized repeat protein (TIGR01451 family)